MNLLIALLRIIHVVGGIFWVGVVWYNALFFLPRVKTFGQERGRIMQTFVAPPLPQAMTGAGLVTVLSGILLYWNRSAGFSRAWILTLPGTVLTVAALAAIFVVIEGAVGLRVAPSLPPASNSRTVSIGSGSAAKAVRTSLMMGSRSVDFPDPRFDVQVETKPPRRNPS